MPRYNVGDKLFLAPSGSHFGAPREIEVTKVGKRWVYFPTWLGSRNTSRFDQETGLVDGQNHSSPGRVYHSRADWEGEIATQRLWREFCREIAKSYASPDGVDPARIQQAAAILGITLPTGETPK